MIKICNILPNNIINEKMPRQEYELYLTHQILKDKEKFAFLRQDKANSICSYKILDNSACELGEGLDFNLVLEAAEVIGANEVVLPDKPQSGSSLAYTLKYLKDVPDNCPYKLAAVAQGSNIDELKTCIVQILGLKRINTIMLPKWYCKLNSTNGLGRVDLVAYTIQIMSLLDVKKDIHLLGLDTGIREIIHPTIARCVRSVDTGYFAAMSTPSWTHLDVTDDRPRELKIDLDNMDVDMNRWNELLRQQKVILGGLQ